MIVVDRSWCNYLLDSCFIIFLIVLLDLDLNIVNLVVVVVVPEGNLECLALLILDKDRIIVRLSTVVLIFVICTLKTG